MKTKFCLTSVIEIPPEIVQKISRFLNKQISNDLYFYLPEQLHITLLGLIPLSDKINITDEDKTNLKKIFINSIKEIKKPILLRFHGLGITSSSIFIKAEDLSGTFNELRRKLIIGIKESGIHIDITHLQSYDLGFAWCTIARFKKAIKAKTVIDSSKNSAFGSFEVKKIQMVITDKNYLKRNTQKMFSFTLK
jgi:2'-5' RNA ligase